MIAAVYTPDGIVLTTTNTDFYYSASREGSVEKVAVTGHPHEIIFWGRYALVYHQTNEFNYSHQTGWLLKSLEARWGEDVPPIHELMPYIKKQIIDSGIEIIGIMAGYNSLNHEAPEPFVYQILGDDIRRINIDGNGAITYNCVLLEKETKVSRLIRDVKIKNGEEWEYIAPPVIRCDLFSIDKAKSLSQFLIESCIYLENLNSDQYSHSQLETTIITPQGIIRS